MNQVRLQTELSALFINAPKALSHQGLMGQSGTLEFTNALTTADPLLAGVHKKHNAEMYHISRAVSHPRTRLAQRRVPLQNKVTKKNWQVRQNRRQKGWQGRALMSEMGD